MSTHGTSAAWRPAPAAARPQFIACPLCGGPADVEEAAAVGPTGLVRVWCVFRHWFLMPRDMLDPATRGAPPPAADRAG